MTKEEVLQKCGEDQYGQSHYDGFKTIYNKEQFALKAMDEYAKQQAIAFYEYAATLGYLAKYGLSYEELYDKFIKQQ